MMTEWDDRISNHPIWSCLDELETSLSKAGAKATKKKDDQALVGVERLKAVESFTRKSLSNADPFLVAENTLKGLSSNCQNAKNKIDQYLNSEDSAHLTISGGGQNAVHFGDELARFASQLPGLDPSTKIEGLKTDVAGFRKSAAAYLAHLKSDVEELEKQVGQTVSKLHDQLEKVEQDTQEKRDELVSDIEQKHTTLKQKIDHEDQRITDALDQFQSRFDEDQKERRDDFKEAIKGWKEDFTSTLSRFEKKGNESVQQMEAHKTKVEKLVGAIGAGGRAKGFEEQADYERDEATKWRKGAVIAMALLVGAAVWLAFSTVGGNGVNWGQFAGKVTLLGAIGVLAGYCVSQGHQHRKREEINRQYQLELTSIGPYLADLDPELQQKLKTTLTPQWFGNLPREAASEKEQGWSKSLLNALREMGEDAFRKGAGED